MNHLQSTEELYWTKQNISSYFIRISIIAGLDPLQGDKKSPCPGFESDRGLGAAMTLIMDYSSLS